MHVLRVCRYVYSPNYRGLQRMFEECQATYDPNSIAQLLRQAPYHVDALLAMYDLYRHMGDHSVAEVSHVHLSVLTFQAASCRHGSKL